jgi:asparagine synthase (glutamine-hydrolysing)
MVGCPHQEYYLEGDFLSAFEQHLRYMVHLTDGQYLCQCIVIPSLPYYRELGIDVLLRGHAGELMHMNKAYNYSLDATAMSLNGPDALSNWLFGRMSEWMTGAVTDDLFMEGTADLARASLEAALSESSSVEPLVHRIWHMFISQRLRRETALSMTEFGSVVETRLPYLDNEVVDALLAVPPMLKVSDRIQTHILTRRRPEFLKVVNSNTGARMGAGRLEQNLAQLRFKVLSKLRVPGYQPYERLGAWLREELRPLVQRLLLAGPLLERGVLRPDALRSVVQQHLDGRRNHTFLLLALMIFETGQRTLVDGAGNAVPIEAVRGGV